MLHLHGQRVDCSVLLCGFKIFGLRFFSFSSPVYKVPGSIFKIDERQNVGDVEEQQQQQSAVSVIGWSIYDFDTTAVAIHVNPPTPPHPLDTSVLINSLETKLRL